MELKSGKLYRTRRKILKCPPIYGDREGYSEIPRGSIIMFVSWDMTTRACEDFNCEEMIFLFEGKNYATTSDVDNNPKKYLEEIKL